VSGNTLHGYLALADISGFTAYVAQVELDHAHEILAELLEKIVGRFKPVLTISKLEGDAVFAYVTDAQFTRGETLLELFEATYAAFRDAIEAAARRTTCPCRACQAIPMLDLKFIVHYGEFMAQNVAGIRELIGSDVNLAHRLMKNRVAEATGWKAYALFTSTALERLGVAPEGLHEQAETYEHLGEVKTFALDLRPRYQAMIEARRVEITPEEAHEVTTRDFAAPPPVLWSILNDPKMRSQWAPEPGYNFVPVRQPGGRTGAGAQTHCVHGKKVFLVENVLDWRPFEYFTVEQIVKGMPIYERATFRLIPLPDGGTRLQVSEWGRTTGLALIDRPFYRLLFTKAFHIEKQMDNIAALLGT
jgi:class 3 adenylate cyclase